jgi:hypothetical protein
MARDFASESINQRKNKTMKTKIVLAVLSLLLVCTARLHAQRFEISPFYGYRFGGEVQNPLTGRTFRFEDAPAYGLLLDVAPKQDAPAKLEVLWSRQDSRVDLHGLSGLGKVDVTIDQIQIGGSLERGQRLREYVSLLVGATYYSTDGYGSDIRFSLGVGGGLKYFLTRNLALRADLRGFCTIVDSSSAFISSGGTTVVAFSGSAVWQGQVTAGVSLAF